MRKSTGNWSVGQIFQQSRLLDLNPEYQRQGNVWPAGTREDFVDSLLNGFDIPKIYLHVLPQGGVFTHAVIDGKQRISTVLEFIDNKFPLGESFKVDMTLYPSVTDPAPKGGEFYRDFPDSWKQILRDVILDVVLVAEQPDIAEVIEELFERLNSGVALSGTEKRHAKTGDMSQVIHGIAKSDFFVKKFPFQNKRYKYEEIAARVATISMSLARGGSVYSDFKRGTLDRLVDENRKMGKKELTKVVQIAKNLTSLGEKVFSDKDHLLSKSGLIAGYLVFVYELTERYNLKSHWRQIQQFLEDFETARDANRNVPEDRADPILSQYTELAGQGLTSELNLRTRVEILLSRYLEEHPETVVPKDQNRTFSQSERWAIWIRGGKVCQECDRVLPDLSSMHADHKTAWVKGGSTTIENAQSLCASCNLAKGGSAN